ncbi:dTMP kinase [Desulfopila inferna]|uniref:dTMP kinase n=1 Tax=Desulfopila inferna TaxID=468528 RepID=UPI001F06C502|nr:dTMP kinase [Desulfopila inferna]
MDQNENSEMKRGSLIVFEGIDGTGKSTQLELLAVHLRASGYDVVTTKEPTEGEFGQRIRKLYLNRDEVTREEELDLFLCDRRDHVEHLIRPSLAEGKIILCDRYYLSTMAYQGAAGMNIDEIARKNNFAPEPDLALIFQLNPRQSIERITSNRGDRLNDFEQEDSLKKVERIFNSLSYPYICYIDADQTIEDVHHAVTAAVYTILNRPE